MIRLAQVLCPVDFSETAQHAVDHAAAIARWYEARLTLVHVFTNLPVMDLPPPMLQDDERERLTVAARTMAARLPAEVPLDVRILEARSVHEEILAQVASTHADLLVLGTHGRSGFQRLFLGSITEKVIRKAECPTLVVPPRAPDVAPDAPVRFRRIVCPVDFSDSSLAALAYAVNLAGEAEARLTLLHVVEIPTIVSGESAIFEADLARIRETAAEEVRHRLDRLVPEDARTFCTVETVAVEGRAYREILRHAAERDADLVVMGVRGRGVVDRLLFGSTTHHVIRAATCPILIVRPTEAAPAH